VAEMADVFSKQKRSEVIRAATRTRNWRWQDYFDGTKSPAGGGMCNYELRMKN
jgi:putative IMPACT (imprinted ancient) family translation regulator